MKGVLLTLLLLMLFAAQTANAEISVKDFQAKLQTEMKLEVQGWGIPVQGSSVFWVTYNYNSSHLGKEVINVTDRQGSFVCTGLVTPIHI